MANTFLKDPSAMTWDHVAPVAISPRSRPRDVAWTLTLDGRTIACELRDESRIGAGWDVAIRQDGELSFSRRCPDEAYARHVANGLKQDHLRAGWTCERCRAERWICEQHPDREWPHEDCAGPGEPCPGCNTKEPPDHQPGFRSVLRLD
jgi:hypothetical protein